MVSEAIVSLPLSLKGMLRVVEDPDVPDEGRIAAAGALLHWLSSSNVIPGVRGLLQYVDDVLVMRLVLERLCQLAPEAMARHREDSPELLGALEDELEASRAYFGELMAVFDKAAREVDGLKHRGHTARACALDDEANTWLYDEIQAALVDLEVEEDEVARAMGRIDSILAPLRQRLMK